MTTHISHIIATMVVFGHTFPPVESASGCLRRNLVHLLQLTQPIELSHLRSGCGCRTWQVECVIIQWKSVVFIGLIRILFHQVIVKVVIALRCRRHPPLRMVDSLFEIVVLFEGAPNSVRYRIDDRFDDLGDFVVSFKVRGRPNLAAIFGMIHVNEDLLFLLLLLWLIRRRSSVRAK